MNILIIGIIFYYYQKVNILIIAILFDFLIIFEFATGGQRFRFGGGDELGGGREVRG